MIECAALSMLLAVWIRVQWPVHEAAGGVDLHQGLQQVQHAPGMQLVGAGG